MKIKINTNCRNGEHVFIPANIFVDGHDRIVTSFVCQHCLEGVSQSEWLMHVNQIQSHREEQEAIRAGLYQAAMMAQSQTGAEILPTETESNPTKKRGPKPKQKEIEGL